MSAVEMIRYGNRWAVVQSEIEIVQRDKTQEARSGENGMGMRVMADLQEVWTVTIVTKKGRRLEAEGDSEFTQEFFNMIVEAMEAERC